MCGSYVCAHAHIHTHTHTHTDISCLSILSYIKLPFLHCSFSKIVSVILSFLLKYEAFLILEIAELYLTTLSSKWTDNLVGSQITVQRIKRFSNWNRIMTRIKRIVHKKPHYTGIWTKYSDPIHPVWTSSLFSTKSIVFSVFPLSSLTLQVFWLLHHQTCRPSTPHSHLLL